MLLWLALRVRRPAARVRRRRAPAEASQRAATGRAQLSRVHSDSVERGGERHAGLPGRLLRLSLLVRLVVVWWWWGRSAGMTAAH